MRNENLEKLDWAETCCEEQQQRNKEKYHPKRDSNIVSHP